MKRIIAIFATLAMLMSANCFAENSSHIDALLGTENGFSDFERARQADENGYTAQVKYMVFVLGDAFNTSQLGTESAQAAIKALVPPSVYVNAGTADAKMSAIYKYYTTGKISSYFTLSFTSDGDIYDVTIPLENVKVFVQDGINCKVFLGDFDYYELNPKITSLDTFCSKMNITKEVAVGMLQLMETYDIGWLDGDTSTLLDEFVP